MRRGLRRIVLMTVLLALTVPQSAFPDTPIPIGGPTGKAFTFLPFLSDEFNAASIDTNRWDTELWYWSGRWPSYFVGANSSLNNGVLQQTMQRGGLPSPTPTQDGQDFVYSVGMLNSKATTTYGYFEARIRTSAVAFNQAFWLTNPHRPKWTEIDIVEQPGSWNTKLATFNAHYFEPNGSGGYVDRSFPGYFTSLTDLTGEYSVYGLYWSPSEISWYVDGVRHHQITNTYWDEPLQILFSQETNVGWLGLPDDADLPTTMDVDYLRVWSVNAVPEPSALVMAVIAMAAGIVIIQRRAPLKIRTDD